MKYHGGERFGLCERKQSYIYWLCQNIDIISPEKGEAIRKLIKESVSGEEEVEILTEALCTKKSLTEIAIKRFTSESAIQRRCEKFYKKAEKVLL